MFLPTVCFARQDYLSDSSMKLSRGKENNFADMLNQYWYDFKHICIYYYIWKWCSSP